MVVIGGKRKFTIEEVRIYIRGLGFVLLSKEYINDKTSLIFKDMDGYYYLGSLNKLKANKIPDRFNKYNPYTIQNIKLWCILNNKPFELISDKYIGADEYLYWKCYKIGCEEIFKTTWHSIFSKGYGCSCCVGMQVGLSNCLATKFPELSKEWHPTLNGDLTPYDVVVGRKKNVWWKCKDCNYEWEAKIYNRSNLDSGCPECSKDSKGELRIQEILNINNIRNSPQFIIKECKDKRVLPFDSAVFNYKNNLLLLIEFDGLQHFRPVHFGGMSDEKAEECFRIIQLHDKIKNNYCIKNNIPLLRIPYWKFKNIEEILVDVLINGNMDSKYFLK